ncbi:hypothetical protein DLAC_10834 [Tieghemostelium lacteum]|uniref:Pinin/SDK/MemA protein domain-containing protein n=1 Tax=Tieghemostelium lacteum TaxID=361077 RepID=A0A151Z3Z1_TIELA|nr:hypothetical protein DLAC_10834 [Tieghemostelium lacteum]|eukprot:KYQ88658.1 hypothetical protein DLAC_10834 [Tieghemostelium lacteum]
MSYRSQNQLINQLKSIEKEKKYVENKIERLNKTEKSQYIGKRDRESFSSDNNNNNNRNGSNNSQQNKRPSTDSSMFQRKVVKSSTTSSGNTDESKSDSQSTTTTITADDKKKLPDNKQRGKMFMGLLNRTLIDFKNETSKKTEADLKREVIENKIEQVISKEEEEREEREKVKKQQMKEKELKHHEDLVKKQELLENKILIEGWNLHERTLSKFKYKTVSKPHIYFTLNSLADKHHFQLQNYLPASEKTDNNITNSSDNKNEDTSHNRRKKSDDDSDDDSDEELFDKDDLKKEILGNNKDNTEPNDIMKHSSGSIKIDDNEQQIKKGDKKENSSEIDKPIVE